MPTPDKTDERLVDLLGQDAKQNGDNLAKQLNLSAATVRRRLRKLLRLGLLRIGGVIDPARFGFPLAALIGIDADYKEFGSVLKTLGDLPEVVWLSPTTGRFDIIAVARFRSSDALSDFLTRKLAEIAGVKDSETFICLDLPKGGYVRIPS